MVRTALEACGPVETDAKVPADTRRIDLWFVPDPARESVPDHLGVLGHIAGGPRTLEFFHNTPSGEELEQLLPPCLGSEAGFADLDFYVWRTIARWLREDTSPRNLGGDRTSVQDVGKPSRGTLRLVDRPSPEQIVRYRAMTPAERLRQSARLYWSARRLREAHERMIHPDWSDDQVHDHVRKIFLRAGT